MGVSFSCPGADYDALDEGFETVIVRSISFNGDEVKTDLRSVSFNGRGDSEPTILKSLGSGKLVVEGSISFKTRQLQTMISIKTPSEMETDMTVKPMACEVSDSSQSPSCFTKTISISPPVYPTPKHEAALKLQKVYKSFRTRRKLADCAVLVEQKWWKLLDFAELKRSSISFFDIERNETAISRWSRARTKAAKVGKGLSKDEKAQKLALQHWLEAIDPRHRYGHNLHFYYIAWLRCESRQPFFYWLDIGDGREVNLVDRCPKSKLQHQCIKYLGPIERKVYEVIVEDGKFLYKHTRELLDTSEGPEDVKWIFVLSTSKTLYVGQKKKGVFQHSSFLAGGATSAAGRLVVENGTLKAVWPHSGHYRPTEQNFQEFVSFLMEHNVDLTDVKKSPIDEEESMMSKHGSESGIKGHPSDSDLRQKVNAKEHSIKDGNVSSAEQSTKNEQPQRIEFHNKTQHFRKKLTSLEIPKRDLFDTKEADSLLSIGPCHKHLRVATPMDDGYETAESSLDGEEVEEHYMIPPKWHHIEEEEEEEDEEIPEELILRRINSKKELTSYQLGNNLGCRWTTGAGPRIGCVRDYPSELQFRVLEEVSLSPRSASHFRPFLKSPKPPTPSTLTQATLSKRSNNNSTVKF